MRIFEAILLAGLCICAAATSFSKRLLTSVIIFMSYSVMMSIVWVILQSPDLAITEAAVGAGVTSILFFAMLRKIRAIDEADEKNQEGGTGDERP